MISGRSQSRASGSGGSTVMRYRKRKPPCLSSDFSRASIECAAAILSVRGIAGIISRGAASPRSGLLEHCLEVEDADQPVQVIRMQAEAASRVRVIAARLFDGFDDEVTFFLGHGIVISADAARLAP